MIKAAIFDMDGLLVDSEPLWHRVIEQVYKDMDVEVTAEHHAAMTGQSTFENTRRLYEQFKWKGPTADEVSDLIVRETIKLIKQEVALMPGVHEVLSVCKKAGLPVAIASSATMDVIDAVVDTLEIREHFHHIYSAQFEEYAKPHPGVFLKVAKRFKVKPYECVVFEDSPPGVLAAKAAHMICVAVPDKAQADNRVIQIADAVIGSLEEFDEAMLKRLG